MGLFLANCCDFVIIDPPVFTVVLSSQTVSGRKWRKIVSYFGLAQKGISYKKSLAPKTTISTTGKAKQELLESGTIRCIDCHMAAYAVSYGHIERFHNLKVEANIPYSCSGGMGMAMTCHDKTSKEWFSSELDAVKCPRKKYSNE